MFIFVVASLLLAAVVAGVDVPQPVNLAEKYYKEGFGNLGADHFPTKKCEVSEINPTDMKFFLYTKTNPMFGDELRIDDEGASLVNSSYNVRRTTKFLIHGWMGSSSEYLETARKYLYEKHVDVIVMDWSKYSKECNYRSTNNVVVPIAGMALGKLMQILTAYGAQPEKNFHVIAFSSGAHIAGVAAKKISPIRINRISALDPNGYEYDYPGKLKLQNSDALFVDVIHTSQPIIGSTRVIGDLSFYPNNGSHPQPTCESVGPICSSIKSIAFWKRTISEPEAYPATRCESWEQFVAQKCPEVNGVVPTAYMGDSADPKAAGGLYFLHASPAGPREQASQQ